jgi:hypothetical protein
MNCSCNKHVFFFCTGKHLEGPETAHFGFFIIIFLIPV